MFSPFANRLYDAVELELILDISPFISNLPLGRDTTQFSTEDASGRNFVARGSFNDGLLDGREYQSSG